MQLNPGISKQEGIPIHNSGLVIINGYIKLLFDRLEITNENKFKNEIAQFHAALYLQYIVTGLSNNEEYLLPLCKVLCGIPLTSSIPNEIEITETNKQLIEGLINTIIHSWSTIGSTTIEGFRGNWLIRNGLLTEKENKWELTVEKRAYDILLNSFPFSFSIVKYPWMAKPLFINWPY